METYTEPKVLSENVQYRQQRKKCLAGLTDEMIDTPIVDLINGLNRLDYCFTLQSCYGHFVYEGQEDPHNLEPLPAEDVIHKVEYRIAYIAFCIENSPYGRRLLKSLEAVPALDPRNIQFCCAEWFWKRQINSYALQVEPDRFKRQDTAVLDHKEALKIEQVRNRFYEKLYDLFEE